MDNELHEILSEIKQNLLDIRDLLRTGTAPIVWNMLEEDWNKHKINKAAYELSLMIERLDIEYLDD
jgi:hypothetical protein